MDPSWFGLPILISEKLKIDKEKFTRYLDKCGIENRPVVIGNFLNQPASSLYNLKSKSLLKNAQIVERNGFFIGLHTKKLANDRANYIAEKLLDIDLIK